MTASLPIVDRAPTPTVAIIGNDAVLAAAPATPVQVAHACLQRGFTVAVPASWGDELVAAEAVRSLASRARGPAVMCVCPFARSRLLAPGPDLAPFLVSLVPPSVATARYLRAVYGDHGIHITYVGACPGAEDSTIDARLTPDAFLADLAEHGISLLEQPLVFDSIVPPDRRRWCSLPGGVPTPEILWSETDTRTLIEIDRDDISTDLAQHIITREHVLLDLAPSLGCVCSGAISSLPPRSARVAVTALEPPRALSPVIDSSTVIALEVPLGERRVGTSETPDAAVASARSDAPTANEELERRLDEILGLPTVPALVESPGPELEAELDAELEAELDAELEAEIPDEGRVEEPRREDPPTSEPATEPAAFEPLINQPVVAEPEHMIAESPIVGEVVEAVEELQTTILVIETEHQIDLVLPSREPDVEPPESDPLIPSSEPEPLVAPAVSSANASETAQETVAPAGSAVRRRTPPPMPARHPASVIPKATASDGRALPRAYVAKRRTPPGGAAVVSASARPVEPEAPRTVELDSPVAPPVSPPPSPAASPSGTVAPMPPVLESAPPSPPPSRASARDLPTSTKQPGESRAPVTAATSAADGDSNPSAIIVVLVALIALGFFVLRSLS